MAYGDGYVRERGGFVVPSTLIRWGAVFAGALVAFSLQALFTTLWRAFAGDPDTGTGIFADYLNWWIGGSAIFSLFVGGVLAGWLSTVRGFVSGFMHGLTVWALVLFAGLFIELPGLAEAQISQQTPWTLFWTFLVGLGTAVVGGLAGGAIARPMVGDGLVDVRETRQDPLASSERVGTAR